MADPVRAYVSIGSNVARERHVRRAVELLARRFGSLDLSNVYESAAVGFAGDPFLNLVAAFDTHESIESVAGALRDIETSCGRRRDGETLGPRTMDLDLLLYGDEVRSEPPPALPRDEIVRYAFVLRPLAELAGDVRHPIEGLTIAELWARFDDGDDRMCEFDLALESTASAS